MENKIGIGIISLLIGLLFLSGFVSFKRGVDILKLEEEIELYEDEVRDLHQTIGEYKTNESWYEDFIDVIIEVKNQEMQNAVLEERIYWLEQEPIIITEKETIYRTLYSCNLIDLIGDIQEALDDGFTFEVVNGVLLEYYNGVATGDTWTNEEITNDYCYIIER